MDFWPFLGRGSPSVSMMPIRNKDLTPLFLVVLSASVGNSYAFIFSLNLNVIEGKNGSDLIAGLR